MRLLTIKIHITEIIDYYQIWPLSCEGRSNWSNWFDWLNNELFQNWFTLLRSLQLKNKPVYLIPLDVDVQDSIGKILAEW